MVAIANKWVPDAIVVMTLDWLISSVLIMAGAGIAGISDVTLRKSLFAGMGSALLVWAMIFIFAVLPVRALAATAVFLGLLIGLLPSLLVIRSVFKTTIGKAALASAFKAAGTIIAMVIALPLIQLLAAFG